MVRLAAEQYTCSTESATECLRAPTGSALDAVGHMDGRAEGGDELGLDRGQDRRTVLVLTSMTAVRSPQSMVGTTATTPSLRVQTVGRSVAMRRLGSGTTT